MKKFLIIVLILIIVAFGVIIVAFYNLDSKTNEILDDYRSIYTNTKYDQTIIIENIKTIKQEVSCGYAVIEMFARWNDNYDITEESLYEKYGGVVTSTGKSFEKEMNKQFPKYKTTMYKYLKNTELIDKVYDSLSNRIPVPFEWAAKSNNEWTLHYSLIIGIDVQEDKITIANPYGETEKINIKEFLDRTSFISYDNMPLFIKLGFAFGMFEKNTIFIVEKI